MASPIPSRPTVLRRQPLRSGRPSAEQAAQLDEDMRQCALGLFLERGYEGTTMEAIARAAGTTKMSLYARFSSKEAIFNSVLEWAIRRPDWPMPEPQVPDFDDLEAALTMIARAALQRAIDPSMVSLGRIAVAQASRFPDIARRTQAIAFWPRQQLVVDLLNHHVAKGAIRAEEPEILAEHFLAMVASTPARLASFGVRKGAAAQQHHTEVAVQLFLRSLRTEGP